MVVCVCPDCTVCGHPCHTRSTPRNHSNHRHMATTIDHNRTQLLPDIRDTTTSSNGDLIEYRPYPNVFVE